MKTLLSAITLTATLALSQSAMAVSTFNLTDKSDPGACTQNSGNANKFGNSYTCSQQGSTADEMSVRAFATTGSGGAYAAAFIGDYSPSGFGVSSQQEGLNASSPNHAIDNNGAIEGLLFSFNSSIALNALTIGWKNGSQGDTDMSVYAWTGSTGNAVTDLTQSTATSLFGGWSLVGSYADVNTNSAKAINGAAVSSSYWLVSAYNSATGGTGSKLDPGNDYFKLQSIAGNFTCVNSNSPACNPSNVPEPASLAMVTFGLLGIFGARRKLRGQRG